VRWPSTIGKQVVAVLGGVGVAVAAILGVRQLVHELFPPTPPPLTSIVFVLDTSSAMRNKPFDGTTKFVAAQKEILDIVSNYSHAATSLRLFSEDCNSEYRDQALESAIHDQDDYKNIFEQSASLEKSNFPQTIERALDDLSGGDASKSTNRIIYVFLGSTNSCGGVDRVDNLGTNDVRFAFFGLGVLGGFEQIEQVLSKPGITVSTKAVESTRQLRHAVNGAAQHDDAGRPHAPSKLTGNSGDGSVSLTWTAPGSDGGSPITGYQITPYIAGNDQEPLLTNSTQTNYTISPLTNDEAYTFTVAAINNVGTGPESVSAGPYTPTRLGATTPDAPSALMGSAGNGSVSLTWTAPGSDGGSPITGYQITPYIAGNDQEPLLTNSTQTNYTISPLTNDEAYTFTVAAINDVGTGPESAVSDEYAPTESTSTTPGGP
jgi:Fibronectin type III domain